MNPGVNTAFGKRGLPPKGPFSPFNPPPPEVPDTPDARVGNAPQSYGYKQPPVNVYIETEPGSEEYEIADRIDWREVSLGMDGTDTRAKLFTHLDAADIAEVGTIGERHFTHLLETLNPDKRVRIMQPSGASQGRVLFQGFPLPQTLSWNERSESFDVECVCEGLDRLACGFYQQLLGRKMRYDPLSEWSASDPDAVSCETLPTVFNAGGRGNRSAEAYPFVVGDTTHNVHLFTEDGAPEAKQWRYVDALRYLALFYVALSEDQVPVTADYFLEATEELVDLDEVPEDPDLFTRLICAHVADVSVQSMNAREGIVLLCDEAGLHMDVQLRSYLGGEQELEAEHYLRVFATVESGEERQGQRPKGPMRWPASDNAPREAPWSEPGERTAADVAQANALVTGTLATDHRKITGPLYLGGPERYEVTLLLRPLWVPDAAHHLDNLETDEEKTAAMDFWDDQFGPEWEPADQEPTEPRSIYHPAHSQFHTVRDVGRLFGFPDKAGYMKADDPDDSEYARDNWPAYMYSPYDPDDHTALVYKNPQIGAGIADAVNWVPRRRPLGDTIGVREGISGRAPVVWINYNAPTPETALATPGWVPLPACYDLDPVQGTVWFKGDNLLTDTSFRKRADLGAKEDNDNLLTAIIEARLAVAITCTIDGDYRMYQDASSGDAHRRRYRIHDHGREVFQKTDTSHNVFADRFNYEEAEHQARDDTERMERFGERDAARKSKATVSGPLELFWFDDQYACGDSFSGVEGLGIEFATFPAIRTVQYVNVPGGGHRTILHLTDLRHTPEVEAA